MSAEVPTPEKTSVAKVAGGIVARLGMRVVGTVVVLAVIAAAGGVYWLGYKVGFWGMTAGVQTLSVGECFTEPKSTGSTVSDIPKVPCGQPHDYEVFANIDMPAGPWPGDKVISDTADEKCYEAFEGYVGISYDDSSLDIVYYVPSMSGWNNSKNPDRTINCIIEDPKGQMTGSVKDSKR